MMLIDSRAELMPPTRLDEGSHVSREIDFGPTVGAINLNIALGTTSKQGSVAAMVQQSKDGTHWTNVCAHFDMPLGSTPVRVPGFQSRFVRVLWQLSAGATVFARIDNAGDF